MCGRDNFHSVLNQVNSIESHKPPKEFHWLSDHKLERAMVSREVKPNSGDSDTIRCQGDERDQGLDLDLSLNIGLKKAKRGRNWDEEEVDSSLSLSLFSSSRRDQKCSRDIEIKNSKALNKLDDEDCNGENERVTSTLDLTI